MCVPENPQILQNHTLRINTGLGTGHWRDLGIIMIRTSTEAKFSTTGPWTAQAASRGIKNEHNQWRENAS